MNTEIVIVTALEEERDSVLALLPAHHKEMPTNEDIRTYFRSNLEIQFPNGDATTYGITVLCLLNYGRLEALNATKDAINRWHPRYVILVGIAGGIKQNEAALGDVLVSSSVVDYELQKMKEDTTSFRFETHKCDPRLLSAAQSIVDDEWMKAIRTKRPHKGRPARRISPVATGDKVVQNESFLQQLLSHEPKLLGVEMEAGGAASACFQSAHRPAFFMVRAVSDLADKDKESRSVKKWRTYACTRRFSPSILSWNGQLKTVCCPPARS